MYNRTVFQDCSILLLIFMCSENIRYIDNIYYVRSCHPEEQSELRILPALDLCIRLVRFWTQQYFCSKAHLMLQNDICWVGQVCPTDSALVTPQQTPYASLSKKRESRYFILEWLKILPARADFSERKNEISALKCKLFIFT